MIQSNVLYSIQDNFRKALNNNDRKEDMKMANVNTRIFKSLNESEYKELYTPKRTLTEATTDVNEVAEEYKEAYHIDLDLKRVPCVIARDKFLSGWGGAEGKTHYQVVLCGDSTEASNIESSMRGCAAQEGLSNIRRDFGVHLSSRVSASYVVGRYASAWNNLSKEWYKRFDGEPSDEDKFNATMDKRMEKLKAEGKLPESEKRVRKGNLNENTSTVKANPIIEKPEFWWLDQDTFVMEFGYSRDDDGWYNYMVEYWKDEDTFHFLKVYEYDTINVEFPEEKKNEIIKMMKEKMGDDQLKESLNDFNLKFNGEATIVQGNIEAAKETLKNLITGINSSNIKEITANVSESENLQEEYSEKLGGEPEDFISDVEIIKTKLAEIDINTLGTHLAQEIVDQFISTCDSQISMAKSRFLGESKEKELKEDEDTVHKMKDCTDDVEVITALEGDTLEIDDMEDWNRLKEIANSLASLQGFYRRLLANMKEVNEEDLEFPIYL